MIKCLDCDKPPPPRKQNEDGELLSDKDIEPTMDYTYKHYRFDTPKIIDAKIAHKNFYLCSKCAWIIHKRNNTTLRKRWSRETNDWYMYDPALEENEEEERRGFRNDYAMDKGLYGLYEEDEIELSNRTVMYNDLEPKEEVA